MSERYIVHNEHLANCPSETQKKNELANNNKITATMHLKAIYENSLKSLLEKEISKVGSIMMGDKDVGINLKNIFDDAKNITQSNAIGYSLAYNFQKAGLEEFNPFIPCITDSINHLLKGEEINFVPYALKTANLVIHETYGDSFGVSYYLLKSNNKLIGGGTAKYYEERLSVDYYYMGASIGAHVGTYSYHIDNDKIRMKESGLNAGGHLSIPGIFDNSVNLKWGISYTYFKPSTDSNGIITVGECTKKYYAKFDSTYKLFNNSITIDITPWKQTSHSEFWKYKEDNTPFISRAFNSDNICDNSKIENEISKLLDNNDNKNLNTILKLAYKCIPTEEVNKEDIYRYKLTNDGKKKYFGYSHDSNDKTFEVGNKFDPNYKLEVDRCGDIINISCKHSNNVSYYEDLIKEVITKKEGIWPFRSTKTSEQNYKPGEKRTNERDLYSSCGNFLMELDATGKPLLVILNNGSEELVFVQYSYDTGYINIENHKAELNHISGKFSTGEKFNLKVIIFDKEIDKVSGDYDGPNTENLDSNLINNQSNKKINERIIFSADNSPLLTKDVEDKIANENFNKFNSLKKTVLCDSNVSTKMWNNVKSLLPSVSKHITELDMSEKTTTDDGIKRYMSGNFSKGTLDCKYEIKNDILYINIDEKGEIFSYEDLRDDNNNIIGERDNKKIADYKSSNKLQVSDKILYSIDTDIGSVNIYAEGNNYYGKLSVDESNLGQLKVGYTKIGNIIFNGKLVKVTNIDSSIYDGKLKNHEIPKDKNDFENIDTINNNDLKIYQNADNTAMKTEKTGIKNNTIDSTPNKMLTDLGFNRNEKISFIFSNLQKFSNSVDIKFMYISEEGNNFKDLNNDKNNTETYKKTYHGNYDDVINQSIQYKKPTFMQIFGNCIMNSEANIKIKCVELKKNYSVEDILDNNGKKYKEGENRSVKLDKIQYLDYELEVNYFGSKICNLNMDGKDVLIYGRFKNKKDISLITKKASDNEKNNVLKFVKTNGIFGITNYNNVEVYVIVENGISITGDTDFNTDFKNITSHDLENCKILNNLNKKEEIIDRITFSSKNHENPIEKNVDIDGKKMDLYDVIYTRNRPGSNDDNNQQNINHDNNQQNINHDNNQQNVNYYNYNQLILHSLKSIMNIKYSNHDIARLNYASPFGEAVNILATNNLNSYYHGKTIHNLINNIEKENDSNTGKKILSNLNEKQNEINSSYQKFIYDGYFDDKQCQEFYTDENTNQTKIFGNELDSLKTNDYRSHSKASVDEKLIITTNLLTNDIIEKTNVKEYTFQKSQSGFIWSTTQVAKQTTDLNNNLSLEEFTDNVNNGKNLENIDLKNFTDLTPQFSNALSTIGREAILTSFRENEFTWKSGAEILTRSSCIYTGYFMQDVLRQKGYNDFSILSSIGIISTCYMNMTDAFARYNYGTVVKINNDGTYNIKINKIIKKKIKKDMIKKFEIDKKTKKLKVKKDLTFDEDKENKNIRDNIKDFNKYYEENYKLNNEENNNESKIFVLKKVNKKLFEIINIINEIQKEELTYDENINNIKLDSDLHYYSDEEDNENKSYFSRIFSKDNKKDNKKEKIKKKLSNDELKKLKLRLNNNFIIKTIFNFYNEFFNEDENNNENNNQENEENETLFSRFFTNFKDFIKKKKNKEETKEEETKEEEEEKKVTTVEFNDNFKDDDYEILDIKNFNNFKEKFIEFKNLIEKNYENIINVNDNVALKYDFEACTNDALRTSSNLVVNQLAYNIFGSNIISGIAGAAVQCMLIKKDDSLSKYQKYEQYANAVLISVASSLIISYTSSFIWSYTLVYAFESAVATVAVKTTAIVAAGLVGGLVVFGLALAVPIAISYIVEFELEDQKNGLIDKINDLIDDQPRIPSEYKLKSDDTISEISSKFNKARRCVHPDKLRARGIKIPDNVIQQLNDAKKELDEKFKDLNDVKDRLKENTSDEEKYLSNYLKVLLKNIGIIDGKPNTSQKKQLKKQNNNIVEGTEWYDESNIEFMLEGKSSKMNIEYKNRGQVVGKYSGSTIRKGTKAVRDGYGEYREDRNGDKFIYKGNYKNDKKDGQGKYYLTDNAEQIIYFLEEGTFKDDIFISGKYERNETETNEKGEKICHILKCYQESYNEEEKSKKISTSHEYFESNEDFTNKIKKIKKGMINENHKLISGFIEIYQDNKLSEKKRGEFNDNEKLHGEQCFLTRIYDNITLEHEGDFINGEFTNDIGNVTVKTDNYKIEFQSKFNNFHPIGENVILNRYIIKPESIDEKVLFYFGSLRYENNNYYLEKGKIDFVPNNNTHEIYFKTDINGKFTNNILGNISGENIYYIEKTENYKKEIFGNFDNLKCNNEGRIEEKHNNFTKIFNGTIKDNLPLQGELTINFHENGFTHIKNGTFINEKLNGENCSYDIKISNNDQINIKQKGKFINDTLTKGNLKCNNEQFFIIYTFENDINDLEISNFRNIAFTGEAMMATEYYNSNEKLIYKGYFDKNKEFPHFYQGLKIETKKFDNYEVVNESSGTFKSENCISVLNGINCSREQYQLTNNNKKLILTLQGKFINNFIVNGQKTYLIDDKVVTYRGGFKIKNNISIFHSINQKYNINGSYSIDQISTFEIMNSSKKTLQYREGKFTNNEFVNGKIYERIDDNTEIWRKGKFNNHQLYGNVVIQKLVNNKTVSYFKGFIENKQYQKYGIEENKNNDIITIYKGQFKDNKYNGNGCLKIIDSKTEEFQKISGRFIDNKCIEGFMIKKNNNHEFKGKFCSSDQVNFYDKIKILSQNKNLKYETIGYLDNNNNDTNIQINNMLGKQILYDDDKKIHEYYGSFKNSIPHGFGIIEKYDDNTKSKRLVIYNNGSEVEYNEFLKILILIINLIFNNNYKSSRFSY